MGRFDRVITMKTHVEVVCVIGLSFEAYTLVEWQQMIFAIQR